jgi:hypothetical protein
MTVLEIVLPITLTAVVTVGVMWWIAFPKFRRRNDNGYALLQLEVEYLRNAMVEMQSQFDRERSDRNKELLEAYRRIDDLEKKEQHLQIIIADLQDQIGNTESKSVTVLGIWPGDNLDTVGEREAIWNAGIEYRPLFGDAATRANIMRELRQGNITIIEIGAHGDAETIFVRNEELTAGWWHRALLGRNVRVAIILACFSDSSVADAFRRAGVPSVIAVQGEIDDKAAVEFAQQFYQLYAAGMPVKQAFDEAKLALDNSQAEKLVLRSVLK